MVAVILGYPSSLLRGFDFFLCVIITLCCEHRIWQQNRVPGYDSLHAGGCLSRCRTGSSRSSELPRAGGSAAHTELATFHSPLLPQGLVSAEFLCEAGREVLGNDLPYYGE